jgi:drug/metabolite transporter (DMT)-like permease
MRAECSQVASPRVDAVVLACFSAFLFGAMTVLLRFPLARGASAEAGALLTILPALAVTLPFAIVEGGAVVDAWPFLLAGLLGPGLSQLFFTLAVRDAGPSRTSIVVGTAPLFSVGIALVLLDEPLKAGLVAGAISIVTGGILLVAERGRPEHVRRVGLLFALGATVVFAARDNLVRWLAIDSDVEPGLAAAATLGAGGALVATYLLVSRTRVSWRQLPWFAPAGLLFGASYVCLFEAYYRGRVTVVSPLVATESLWGVTLSALVLQRHELVGRRLYAGAALVVAGGMLIGAVR